MTFFSSSISRQISTTYPLLELNTPLERREQDLSIDMIGLAKERVLDNRKTKIKPFPRQVTLDLIKAQTERYQ